MTHPASNQPITPGMTSVAGFPLGAANTMAAITVATAAAGSQMDSSFVHPSVASRMVGPDLHSLGDEDTKTSASASVSATFPIPPLPRQGQPDASLLPVATDESSSGAAPMPLEVPPSSYQASYNQSMFYHRNGNEPSHYRLLHSRPFTRQPTYTHRLPDMQVFLYDAAAELQRDINNELQLALLAESVNSPRMFEDQVRGGATSVMDVDRVRNGERRIAAGHDLWLPPDAVRVGSHCVTLLGGRPGNLLLPGNDDRLLTFGRLVDLRTGRGAQDTESLHGNTATSEDGDLVLDPTGDGDDDSERFIWQ